jgi:cytidine deaminase
MDNNDLVKKATEAKRRAYAPYSGFNVGAAVETVNGDIYTGANIENISSGATVCAERTAIFKAVSEGDMGIKRIAVISDSDNIVYPCGICRQVIREFSKKDTKVICADRNGNYRVYTIDDLYPNAFERHFT